MFAPRKLAQVQRLLLASQDEILEGCRIKEKEQISAVNESRCIYQVECARRIFILRFPMSQEHLKDLEKEERIQTGLVNRAPVLIPNTRVIHARGKVPAFAFHRKIEGEPLTDACLARMTTTERGQLVADLVSLFCSFHAISLETACDWLDFRREAGRGIPLRQELADLYGKPLWFTPQAVADLHERLKPRLDDSEWHLFEETAGEFQQIQAEPGWMVFGHGDLHGFNMAIVEGAGGKGLNGVFDLGCSGILDIHEDFFRLSLIGEPLLDEVLQAYQERTAWKFKLDRQRLSLYYRAFLFYLMAEQEGDGLSHLKRMLASHLVYQPASLDR